MKNDTCVHVHVHVCMCRSKRFENSSGPTDLLQTTFHFSQNNRAENKPGEQVIKRGSHQGSHDEQPDDEHDEHSCNDEQHDERSNIS